MWQQGQPVIYTAQCRHYAQAWLGLQQACFRQKHKLVHLLKCFSTRPLVLLLYVFSERKEENSVLILEMRANKCVISREFSRLCCICRNSIRCVGDKIDARRRKIFAYLANTGLLFRAAITLTSPTFFDMMEYLNSVTWKKVVQIILMKNELFESLCQSRFDLCPL